MGWGGGGGGGGRSIGQKFPVFTYFGNLYLHHVEDRIKVPT